MCSRHSDDKVRVASDARCELSCGEIGRVAAEVLDHASRLRVDGISDNSPDPCAGRGECRYPQLRAQNKGESLRHR